MMSSGYEQHALSMSGVKSYSIMMQIHVSQAWSVLIVYGPEAFSTINFGIWVGVTKYSLRISL